MDASPSWTRPIAKPHRRRGFVTLGLLAFAGGVVGGGWALARSRTTVVPLTMPVVVSVPAPIANVTLPAPVVQVTVAPPPPPPPAEKAVAPPRAVTPYLDADCLLPSTSTDADTDVAPSPCEWDAGFPAVSADGKLVVYQDFESTPSDGSTTDEWLEIVDTRSSRVVRQLTLFTSHDLATDPAKAARARARVARRVAAAQRILDDGRFRTMIPVGESSEERQQPIDPAMVHAEIAGERVRIVDPAAATVLWQGRFGVDAPRPRDEDDDCSGWNLHSTSVWWDPDVKVVFAQLTYFTGGCMCSDLDFFQARRAS